LKNCVGYDKLLFHERYAYWSGGTVSYRRARIVAELATDTLEQWNS